MTAEELTARESRLKSGIGLLVLITVLDSLAGTVADPDLWGYLAFGRLFWEGRQFPYHDVFSYVPTLDPWIYHEWLTGVLFYPIYQSLGAYGLQLLKYVLGLAAAGFIYLTALKRGAPPVIAALGVWVVNLFLVMGYSPVRAQVFTYAFFPLYLYLLESARITSRWRGLWYLVPIQVLWCNLHGGFVSGLGLIALYALGEALSRRPFRPYLGVLLASVLITLLNPYGPAYWNYILRAITMPRPDITEWASVVHAYQRSLITSFEFFYLLAMIVFSALLAWWARWREATAGLALAVTLYLGLRHLRHQVFFMMLVGAYLPVLVTAYWEVLRSRPSFMARWERLGLKISTLLVAFMLVVYSFGFLRYFSLNLKIPPQPGVQTEGALYYPVGAIKYIQKHRLSGTLLIEFIWGEYALWTTYPQCRVALDGRYETVYPEAVAQEYFDFLYGRDNWRQFLEHYPADMILISLKVPAYPLILKESRWRLIYSDTGCALFLRSDSLAASGVLGQSRSQTAAESPGH